MSRWIDEKDGHITEEIADMDSCKYLWSDTCCNDKSEFFAYCPTESMCENCPNFIKEDGKIYDGHVE